MGENDKAQVQIDAHVIRQLGDQLVTDAEQALLELVKNCWDADASSTRIVVDTQYDEDGLGLGRISITDDGVGMDWDTIEKGWLTISLSPKRAMKESGKTTDRYHRTPLGDKGLGRLGTMKLGNVIQITTHTHRKKPGWFVSLTWSDFSSGQLLSNVKVESRPLPPTGGTGTRVDIIGLVDPAYWRGERQLRSLEVRLSTLVSPFEEFSTFKLQMLVDGKPIQFEKVSKELRQAANAQFTCTWSGKSLACRARYKLALFATGSNNEQFEEWVSRDSGANLYRFLEKQDGAKDFNLKTANAKSWYLELSKEWEWSQIRGKRTGNAPIVDPGPFMSELDAFSLSESNAEHEDLELSLVAYRTLIKDLAGIRIYRNGFAIRMEEDWLELGKSQTSGASYYGLRPGNTIGFVALTAADNATLQEKSDREGFIDSPALRGFRDLMGKFAEFANESLTFLRRAYVDFKHAKAAEQVALRQAWEPEDAIGKLRALSTAAKRTTRLIETAEKSQRQSLEKTRSQISQVLEQELPKRARAQLREALDLVSKLSEELEAKREQLGKLISEIVDEEKLSRVVLERFTQMQSQINEVYETVGLGLVAQALAHDMHAIVDDLLLRTQKISKRIRDSGDPSIGGYLEAVRTTSNLIRKQLTLLDPMLRTAREGRQTFSVADFVREFADLRRDRLRKFDIEVAIEPLNDFKIHFNRGRLLQIFDNLFRNSEYWLRQHSTIHPRARLAITIEIHSPFVTLWDTGPGVSKSVEHTLFDLFVTDKPRTEGSGLGLFIVRQLLQQENCNIRLASERNRSGRRYQFTIDMAEAMPDE